MGNKDHRVDTANDAEMAELSQSNIATGLLIRRPASNDRAEKRKDMRQAVLLALLGGLLAGVSSIGGIWLTSRNNDRAAERGAQVQESLAEASFLRDQQIKAYSEFLAAAQDTQTAYRNVTSAVINWEFADTAEADALKATAEAALDDANAKKSAFQVKYYAVAILGGYHTSQRASGISGALNQLGFDLFFAVNRDDPSERYDEQKISELNEKVTLLIGEFLSESRLDFDVPACPNRDQDCVAAPTPTP